MHQFIGCEVRYTSPNERLPSSGLISGWMRTLTGSGPERIDGLYGWKDESS
jgi:hypothetical protein